MRIFKTQTNNYSKSGYAKIGHQIHKTGGTDSLRELSVKGTNKSANALFKRNGDVYEIVDGKNRAWSSGRINQPSYRAKQFMLKNIWGRYVKLGYYLYQWEFECKFDETYTEEQYTSFIEYCSGKEYPIIPFFFLTHKDTAVDKPDLERERTEILRRANEPRKIMATKPNINVINTVNKEEFKKEIISLINKL